jgi:hypothetical protein
VYALSKSLKEGQTKLKTYKDYTLCRERYGQRFWDSQGVLFIDFLKERRTVSAPDHSNFLKTNYSQLFVQNDEFD